MKFKNQAPQSSDLEELGGALNFGNCDLGFASSRQHVFGVGDGNVALALAAHHFSDFLDAAFFIELIDLSGRASGFDGFKDLQMSIRE